MKKVVSPNGRRHGLRARLPLDGRAKKTVLTFERSARVYCWSTDHGRGRPALRP
ncbi:MAG TPA: hypothetical protein VH309_02015 [Elusimicrobiota bacterium]|nr:hypothetical protein [Elusimicrobiota bacterium]